MRSLLLPAACAALLTACGTPSTPPTTEQPPQETCADGVQDQGETGVDCGGPCAPCAAGTACRAGPDCASGVCSAGTCAPPSCTDGVQNGDETGIDCGGPTCAPCTSGVECTSGAECTNGVCLDGACDCGDATDVYVSSGAGDDRNPGTATAPLATIQAAVACAHKVPRKIRVAGGTYAGSAASPIVLLEGKSLVGGWSPDFAQQSPAEHPSEIRDTTDTTGTGIGSGVAVFLSATSTATVLEGFTIQATTLGAGPGAIGAAALMLSLPPAGAPAAKVKDNVIRCGGNADFLFSACIDLGTAGGTLVLENNEIHLGTAHSVEGTASGIRDRGVPVTALEVVGNLFEGGSAAEVIAVQAASATTAAIRNNVIVVPGGGIGIAAAGAEISNNTIVAETGTGIRADASGAQIRNNAIQMAGGTCVAEASGGAAPASFQNNDVFGCAALYDAGAGTPVSDPTKLPGSGNLSADPKLDAANGDRPQAGSPLLGAGLNLSAAFQTDKAGDPRPASGSWSIGAYENP